MTSSQLLSVAGSTGKVALRFLPYLIDACSRYNIQSPIRQVCFLSQIAHESGGFYYTEELAPGAAYQGRCDLGDTEPGDGERFKGRGLIQITGRRNYTLISADLHVDFVDNPTLLGGKNVNVCTPGQLQYAALSAGWFWNKAALNAIADEINPQQPIDEEGLNHDHFLEITRRVNGGYNGLADRMQRYKEALHAYFPDPAAPVTTP